MLKVYKVTWKDFEHYLIQLHYSKDFSIQCWRLNKETYAWLASTLPGAAFPVPRPLVIISKYIFTYIAFYQRHKNSTITYMLLLLLTLILALSGFCFLFCSSRNWTQVFPRKARAVTLSLTSAHTFSPVLLFVFVSFLLVHSVGYTD